MESSPSNVGYIVPTIQLGSSRFFRFFAEIASDTVQVVGFPIDRSFKSAVYGNGNSILHAGEKVAEVLSKCGLMEEADFVLSAVARPEFLVEV